MQSEIYALLKRSGRAMTVAQISAKLGLIKRYTNVQVNKLAKYKLIKKIPKKIIIKSQKHRIYHYKAL